jgi:3-isopropylmalate/(R)-2-methylmalate dehydratase large subunit
MGLTMAEKIFSSKNISGKETRAGDLVTARIDGVVGVASFSAVHHNVVKAGMSQGLPRVWDIEKVYYIMDHFQPAQNSAIAEKNRVGREMARRLGLKYVYESVPTVGHQMICDKGFARPGELVIANDSHATIYGGFNAAGTGVGEAEMAYALVFGELWFQVPQSIQVLLRGKTRAYPFAKDILLYLAGTYGDDFAQYRSVEFAGEAADTMPLSDRLCLAAQSVDVGAKFGLFGVNAEVERHIRTVSNRPFEPVAADADARYERTIDVDVDSLDFYVAKPHRIGNVAKVDEVKNVRIDQAVIGACSNGRFDDINVAAKILKGKKIAPHVRFLIQPASWDVYRRCLSEGIIPTILDSGAYFLEPGCGCCQPMKGYLSADEVCITSTTRNYKGRIGSTEAQIYLGGPATVAASALAGEIINPKEVLYGVL